MRDTGLLGHLSETLVWWEILGFLGTCRKHLCAQLQCNLRDHERCLMWTWFIHFNVLNFNVLCSCHASLNEQDMWNFIRLSARKTSISYWIKLRQPTALRLPQLYCFARTSSYRVYRELWQRHPFHCQWTLHYITESYDPFTKEQQQHCLWLEFFLDSSHLWSLRNSPLL